MVRVLTDGDVRQQQNNPCATLVSSSPVEHFGLAEVCQIISGDEAESRFLFRQYLLLILNPLRNNLLSGSS